MIKTFRNHLNEKLKDEGFKKIYDEEKKLVDLAIEIHSIRESEGFTQNDIAKKAHITQQQISKIENGENCNLETFLKVCQALNLEITLTRRSRGH